eukprot:TRINITY_DN4056_c0_g1_i2.p1 TRINITY_DN4056_c0_g1~~TRINITY_DN4056_c0_g1_i2.p1  ORF type:complete len:189 (-),score=33.69 TRINITY_DN4056_c0_g1_i2:145-711(-)
MSRHIEKVATESNFKYGVFTVPHFSLGTLSLTDKELEEASKLLDGKKSANIHIHYIHGYNLAAKDVGNKSDPFITVRPYKYMKQGEKLWRSSIKNEELDPVWKYDTPESFKIDLNIPTLTFQLYDKDKFGNDFMGQVLISPLVLNYLFKKCGKDAVTIQFGDLDPTDSEGKRHKVSGSIKLRLSLSFN